MTRKLIAAALFTLAASTATASVASAHGPVAGFGPTPPPTPSSSPERAQPTGDETLISGTSQVQMTGWYLAASSGYTMLGDRDGFVQGMRGAIVLNDSWGIGLAGYVISTSDTDWNDDEGQVGGYGGLYLQYVLQSSKLFHAYIDSTIGSGGWCEQSIDEDCDTYEFGFVEPTVNAEINLHKNIKLSVGVGYRQTFAEEGPKPEDGLSGVVARTTLVLGSF